jgi:hypothetical protein
MIPSKIAQHSPDRPRCSSAALIAIAKNAIRHLKDADEHFKRQQYASSLSAAVLSIEETGKLLFMGITGRLVKNTHVWKQIPFVTFLKLMTGLQWAADWQKILKEGLPINAVLSPEQQKYLDAHPEYVDLLDKLRAGELPELQQRVAAFTEALRAQENRDGTANYWLPYFDGYFHKLRMQATYVDIADTGEVTSDPARIEPVLAEAMFPGALLLLFISTALVLPAEHENLCRLIPDNITGTETVLEIIQNFKKLFPQPVDSQQYSSI